MAPHRSRREDRRQTGEATAENARAEVGTLVNEHSGIPQEYWNKGAPGLEVPASGEWFETSVGRESQLTVTPTLEVDPLR